MNQPPQWEPQQPPYPPQGPPPGWRPPPGSQQPGQQQWGNPPSGWQPPRQSWRSRHKVLAPVLFAGGGLIVLIIVLGIVAAVEGNKPPSCSASACATSEIQRSLIGFQARDGAAITKASCSGAVLNAGNTWTATCTVTESDGSVTQGKGNWFVSQNKVTYEPTG